MPVSVNISPVELQRGHLDAVIANALSHTGLDPALLVQEITESGLVADTAAVHDLLTRLLGMGVRVTIDDFLTGYSNMTYLRKFEISGLKVDRSFVAPMTRRRADRAIVGAVVQMARALSIPVIAEGVETEQQRAGLQELGCQLGQGYLFAKPLLPRRPPSCCAPRTRLTLLRIRRPRRRHPRALQLVGRLHQPLGWHPMTRPAQLRR